MAVVAINTSNYHNRNEAIKRLIINIRDRMHIYLYVISKVMHKQNAQSINFNPRARTRLYKHIHRIKHGVKLCIR